MSPTDLPEIPEEDEEVLGTPTFEVFVRNGVAITSGSYFMAPPIYMRDAEWDPQEEGRLVVTATDGSRWHAVGISRVGRVNVVLHRL